MPDSIANARYFSRYLFFTALLVLMLALAFAFESAPAKRLMVYLPRRSFSVPVIEHSGKEYAALSDLLQPFATPEISAEGKRWKVKVADLKHLNNGKPVEAEFSQDQSDCKILGRKVVLSAPIIASKGRLLVPLHGIGLLLQPLLGMGIEFHENSRRLFLDNAAVHFYAEPGKTKPGVLTLQFPAPVKPTVSADGNRLKLTFTRDPAVSSVERQSFKDPVIAGFNYSESNGSGELLITGTAPLFASLADGGRTINIAAAPALQDAGAQSTSSTPSTSGTQAASVSGKPAATVPTPTIAPTPGVPAATRPVSPAMQSKPFLVVIDPAHGGLDLGSRFSATANEKDVTLAFARRLRTELQAQKLSVLLLRDSDIQLTAEQRAIAANTAQAAIFISIHAGLPHNGVRVFTSMLPETSPNSKVGLFVPWENAQAASLGRSRDLAYKLTDEFHKALIAASLQNAPLPPLNSVVAPAIAVELSPMGSREIRANRSAADLITPEIQKSMAKVIATVIAAQRPAPEAAR